MNRIKDKRDAAKLTQVELSKLLGISQSAIAMWETGQSFPRTELLPKLAEILNCSVDELLGIEKS